LKKADGFRKQNTVHAALTRKGTADSAINTFQALIK